MWESVVKVALKRLKLTRNHGIYTVDTSYFDSKEVNILDDQIKQNQILLENLYDFIQMELSEVLIEEKKKIIQSQFYSFLLNGDVSDEYSLLINDCSLTKID